MELPANKYPKIQFIKQPENFGCRIVGDVYQQMEPFAWHEHDWNNDGDVYSEKVAKFEKVSSVNLHSASYLTLTELEFRDLKNSGCIDYFKEQPQHTIKPLSDIIASAEMKKTQPGPVGPGDNKGGRTAPDGLGGR